MAHRPRRINDKQPAEDFQSLQKALAAHLRDPEKNPAPGNVEERGLQIYRTLFINNIAGFISNTFPVLRSLYSTGQWDELVRMFYSRHKSHTPYFAQIAREFLDYVENEHAMRDCDPPFMLELAHYEWIELALSNAEQDGEEDIALDPAGDVIENCPVISPFAWRLCYEWPVHRIRADYRPAKPGDEPTWLIVHRTRNERIGFVEINAATALLLETIERHPGTGTGQLIKTITAGNDGGGKQRVLVDGARQILEELRDKGIILGTRTPSQPA